MVQISLQRSVATRDLLLGIQLCVYLCLVYASSNTYYHSCDIMTQTVLTGADPFIIHCIMWMVQAEDGLLVDLSIQAFLIVQDHL